LVDASEENMNQMLPVVNVKQKHQNWRVLAVSPPYE
jgi:hypothetical protein